MTDTLAAIKMLGIQAVHVGKLLRIARKPEKKPKHIRNKTPLMPSTIAQEIDQADYNFGLNSYFTCFHKKLNMYR